MTTKRQPHQRQFPLPNPLVPSLVAANYPPQSAALAPAIFIISVFCMTHFSFFFIFLIFFLFSSVTRLHNFHCFHFIREFSALCAFFYHFISLLVLWTVSCSDFCLHFKLFAWEILVCKVIKLKHKGVKGVPKEARLCSKESGRGLGRGRREAALWELVPSVCSFQFECIPETGHITLWMP